MRPQRTTLPRICAHCGIAFTGRLRNEFCSRACYYASEQTPDKVEARFWARVNKAGPLPYRADLGPCWPWTGKRHKTTGYGMVRLVGSGKETGAHQFSWALKHGPVPPKLTLDHVCHTTDPTCRDWDTCRHRPCVNPDHLEVITRGENSRRGHNPVMEANRAGVCLKGHPTILRSKPSKNGRVRNCRTCANEVARASRERRRPAVPFIDPAKFGAMKLVDTSRYQRLLECPCGARIWTARGKAARHAQECSGPWPDDEMIDKAVALARTGTRPTLREIADE